MTMTAFQSMKTERGLHLIHNLGGHRSHRRPLILLMGYSGSTESWTDEFLESLGSEIPLVAVDTIGTGRSRKDVEPARLSYEEVSKDLAGMLDELAVPSAHWLGYSYGGTVAMSFADIHPGRTESLILVSTILGGKSYHSPDKAVLAELANPSGETVLEKTRSIWRVCLGADVIERYTTQMDTVINAQEGALTPRSVLGQQLRNYMGFDFAEKAASIRVPTTVLSGAEDPLTPAKNSEEIARAVPAAKLFLFEGVRHMPHIECPDKLREKVLGHLGGAGAEMGEP